MWKLWKSTPDSSLTDIVERVRILEATTKAQDLEIESLHGFVKAAMGRYDKKRALNEGGPVAHVPLTREEIVRRANGGKV
jgi:hypothetical protein